MKIPKQIKFSSQAFRTKCNFKNTLENKRSPDFRVEKYYAMAAQTYFKNVSKQDKSQTLREMHMYVVNL